MKTRTIAMRASIAALLSLTAATAVPAATQTVIHSFGDVKGDGYNPQSDLIADPAGNLYGTTLYSGANGSCCGAVFMLTPAGNNVWNETILYAFQGGTDGASPNGGLAIDRNGNLFGTTESGGANGQGTVFELAAGTWQETVLYSFCPQTNCPDGRLPLAGVTIGKKGVLYGTTELGGTGQQSSDAGTVFQLTPPKDKNGSWSETVLHTFCSETNCADGWIPMAGRLLLTKAGVLWGTASRSDQAGTLFSLSPNGSGFTVAHDFSLSNGDGRGPYAGVVADRNGVLYGTTVSDSVNECGTIYAYNQSGHAYSQLYVFCPNGDHSTGAWPYAGVVVSGTTLYGTTFTAGANNAGVVYKLTGSTETVLHAFCPKSGCSDGANPGYGSLLTLNRKYYGTTTNGGNSNNGVAYSITKK